MGNKHIPLRTCVICRTVRPKRELLRVVQTSAEHLEMDATGKKNGRGAYLCRQRICWDAVQENPARLTSALKSQTKIAADDLARFREISVRFPVRLETPAPDPAP
ncbi:MAG: YlxR family protein [Chloroflexi bacterium]|nr:YlxR family protein [Chloroflexota bacterium]